MQRSFSCSVRRRAWGIGRKETTDDTDKIRGFDRCYPWLLISRLRARIGHGALVSILINRPDPKKIIVLRHPLHRKTRHVSDRFRVGPHSVRRLTPDDLVTSQIRLLV